MNILSPSILAADFAQLGDQIRQIDEAGAAYVHIDVMDGSFVPSISFGFPIMESIRGCTKRIFDVHLMIEEPIRYVEEFARAGADIITVHAEACRHLDRTIDAVKSLGLRAGAALNPATPVGALKHVLGKLDMALVMTVNPGYGGQSLIPYTLDKVGELKRLIDAQHVKVDIEVDGGMNQQNVHTAIEAGANVIVAGSAVFDGDISGNVRRFLEAMQQSEGK